MKNLILVNFLVFFVASVYGQRKVEQNFNVAEKKKINLNFKFADDIKIIQWDRQLVKVDATVVVDDGKGNDDYSLKSEESSGEISIASDFGDYFERKNNNIINNCNSKTEISYVVYVPKNCRLRVESTTGDVFSETFTGNLETDLIAGNVELKQYDGELLLKTISGNLDITMKKAEIDAKTLTGTIYSNLDIKMPGNGKRSSNSNRVTGAVNNGGEKVKLETISGNIYMRKG